MKDDEVLQNYRRTINLEIASSIAEILDAKAIIYALHPELISISSSFDHIFYKNYVKKNIPVKNLGYFEYRSGYTTAKDFCIINR
ncbi:MULTISPECIES: hypothetical protein [unclassified Acinetobacter]|uniref:hypothetical protein n=1 Tax=unclassified Acinetobacter TaxID=196816 RepID=UPI0015D4172E|nr:MULTISPECIES: hypothetical protein [unclassified Acinetobacter]